MAQPGQKLHIVRPWIKVKIISIFDQVLKNYLHIFSEASQIKAVKKTTTAWPAKFGKKCLQ